MKIGQIDKVHVFKKIHSLKKRSPRLCVADRNREIVLYKGKVAGCWKEYLKLKTPV